MKNLIYILLIISTFGSFTVGTTNPNQTIQSINRDCISDFQNDPMEIILIINSGGSIRHYNLITLFINNDLCSDFIFGTLMLEVGSPGDHIQIPLKGGEKIMVTFRNSSNSELKKKRIAYYAAKRKVDSLEDKKRVSITVIKTGKKERVKVNKQTKEKTVVVVKLTSAQIKDEKRILAETVLKLEMAKDELKKKDFGFSSATKTRTDAIMTTKQAYRAKKQEEKIKDVKALVNSAVINGSLQNVLDLQKLSGDSAKINDVKSELMKIVRKENKNGYPIKNVSNKTVEIIMAGLLNWDPETVDQPFEIS